ncbi:MAG: cupin-like domain-containing protein [Bdellovibrionota bacterium]|nr:MAG: transcriptional regulator [Pseudomonadota bacterium]
MTPAMKCFDTQLKDYRLDHDSFKFHHKLLGHPAMDMKHLCDVIPKLAADGNVYYSSGKLSTNANLDRAYLDHKNGLSIEETVHRMKDVDSYIFVRGPETQPAFKDLFAALCSDVDVWLKLNGFGCRTIDPLMFIFVASPNSVTPFHIDRISTLLMQFQGNKTVTVFPAWDHRTVQPEVLENYMIRSGDRPVYDPSFENLGHPFEFGPGEAIHIPFVAPHHVKNGADEVSISLSITFHSTRSEKLKEAMFLNRLMRKRLKMRPTPVGENARLDLRKAGTYSTYTRVRDSFKKKA